jgi:hypothetical protein
MSRIVLGNRHATDSLDHGATRFALPKGKRATVVDLPEDWTLSQAFLALTAAGGIWDTNTQTRDEDGVVTSTAVPDKPGAKPAVPAWVASDDAALASLIAAHFGGLAEVDVEIRDLEDPR